MLILLAVFGSLYWLTAATTIQGADNWEFSTLFATGGVAHPSGYPLYTLLLRAFSWIPASTPAQGAALVTAGVGVIAIALLYFACLAWGARPSSAALAATFYGVSPIAWDLSTQAEVFALNAALAAAILLVAAPEAPLRGRARLAALGLLAGLGLSNNHTIVLMAPLGLWALRTGAKESARPWQSLGLGVGALLLGLSPYATLPFAAHGDSLRKWVWGNFDTPSEILHHFLRTDYGTMELALGAAKPRPLEQIANLGARLFTDLHGVPLLVGLGFLVIAGVRSARDGARSDRFAIASLAGAFLLAGPAFASVVRVESSPEGLAIVRRFHLLPALVLSVPFALGADALLRRASLLVRFGLVLAALFGGVALGLPAVGKERRPMLENYLFDSLHAAPENAVLLGSGDARMFGFLYVKRALGIRPDVVFVSPLMLHYPWYHRRFAAELGMEIPAPKNGSLSTVDLAETLLSHGRPVFLTDEGNFAIIRHFATYPIGTLIAVLPSGMHPPPPDALERMNLSVFADYKMDASVSDVKAAWTRGAREGYMRPWSTLAAAYAARGDLDGAARNERRAQSIEATR